MLPSFDHTPIDIPRIVRYLPQWFPGTRFQVRSEQARKLNEELRNLPYKMNEEKMVRELEFITVLSEKINERCLEEWYCPTIDDDTSYRERDGREWDCSERRSDQR